MSRTRIKNHLKTGVFIFGVLLALTNCTKDERLEKEQSNFNQHNENSHKINLIDYPKLSNYINKLKLPKEFVDNSHGLLKDNSISDSFYSVKKYIEDSGNENYKLQVITEIKYDDLYFSDIWIKETPNQQENYQTYLLKYKPDIQYLINNNFKINANNYSGELEVFNLKTNSNTKIEFEDGNVVNPINIILYYGLICGYSSPPHYPECYGFIDSDSAVLPFQQIIPPSEGPILGGGESGGGPSPEQEAIIQEYMNNVKNCLQLNMLLSPNNANLTPIIEDLKTQINTTGEVGVSLQKNNGTYSNPALTSTTGLGIGMPVLNYVYGVIHTHPALISYPMFTWTDVNSMRRMYTKTDANNRSEVTIMLVSQKYPEAPKVYALKINNFFAFRTQLDRDIAKVRDELELNQNDPTYYDDLYDGLNKKFGKKFKTTNDYEQAFLESFGNNYNISLYKANDDTSNWSKLSLDETFGTVIETPCN